MGGTKDYNSDGGFYNQKYKQTGTTANGIKTIEPKDKNKNTKTPTYSNTPNTMYAKISGDKVNQVAVYGVGSESRGKLKDIDIGHRHTNPDKKLKFSENDIHVHDYYSNEPHSLFARKPSKKEKRLLMIARYGKMN